MKNKIVKALVLASIVSMTATGAAGLTFADENVATGDTATTTTDTATKKTVDDLEADLTAAQKAAAEKNTAFTEKFDALKAAEKAVTDATAVNADKTKLVQKLNDASTAFSKENTGTHDLMVAAVRKTDSQIASDLGNNADTSEKLKNYSRSDKRAYNDYIQGRNELAGAAAAYELAVLNYVNNVGQETTEEKIKAINTAKTKLDEVKGDVQGLYDQVAKMLAESPYVPTFINQENTMIQTYEEALDNLLSSKKEIDSMVTDEDELKAAVTDAKKELKKATEAYKKALTDLGTAKSAYEKATADLVEIYRLYHPTTHEHLWTKDANEKKVLSTERGWIYEGVAWLTEKKGTDAVPLYRLVYPFSGDHHYTTSENEVKDLTTKYGWISEDVAFYVPKEGDVPVYRLFNPGLKMGAHHFTTGENEYNTLGERGWTKENVAYKVSAKGALDTSEIKTEDSRIADAEKAYATT